MISRASLAIGLFAGISVGVANASDLTCRARIERTCLLSGCELLPTDDLFIFHVDRDWLEWKSKIGLGFGQMSMSGVKQSVGCLLHRDLARQRVAFHNY